MKVIIQALVNNECNESTGIEVDFRDDEIGWRFENYRFHVPPQKRHKALDLENG